MNKYKKLEPIFQQVSEQFDIPVSKVRKIWLRQFQFFRKCTNARTILIELTNIGLFAVNDYYQKSNEARRKWFIDKYGEKAFRELHPELKESTPIELGIQGLLANLDEEDDGGGLV